jgi:uncharacterized membrane protein YdjX (TVP38/TMEM64 family)
VVPFSDLLSLFIILGGLIVQVFLPGFPKEVLLFQSGATYGLFFGSVINWIGMVVGAQVAYEVVRKSIEAGGQISQKLDNYKNSKMIKYVKKRGNRGLFVTRLIPIAPNDVLSMIGGAILLPRKGFFLVSVITAIPYAILFAYLGTIGEEFVSTQTLLIVNSIFLLFSLTIYLVRMKHSQLQNPLNTET